MVELKNNRLVVSFPEVHPRARFSVEFQRTFRIPDDGKAYTLPPGLGCFPLRHVDDFAETVPRLWVEHGGVMLPMYQSEALWLKFSAGDYPFALKVAAGKINAMTGGIWNNDIHRNLQDYLVIPPQTCLDGYCVRAGVIRQFVAMPLGAGYTAEEQLTGLAETGGLQLVAYPIKQELYDQLFGVKDLAEAESCFDMDAFETESLSAEAESFGGETEGLFRQKRVQSDRMMAKAAHVTQARGADMGMAPGGTLRQGIHKDTFDFSAWDQNYKSRCFVHLCNSMLWRDITGENPPTVPLTAKDYTDRGYPWSESYAEDQAVVQGSERLAHLKSAPYANPVPPPVK